MRVLLVEDHEEIWDFLSRRLKRRGFDVTVATDGQAGVDRTRADLPDIVLLDMNLPVMDGLEATALIRHPAVVWTNCRVFAPRAEKGLPSWTPALA